MHKDIEHRQDDKTVLVDRQGQAPRQAALTDAGATPRQTKALLDAPFYSRSLVQTQIEGETVCGVHEALDLGRFRSPIVKGMLACRVPRRAGWRFDQAE